MRHADNKKGDEESSAKKGSREIRSRVEVGRHGWGKERADIWL